MRMVWCRDRDSHMRLPDNRCRNNIANSTKPLTMESCKNAGPCFTTPTWKHGDWSEVHILVYTVCIIIYNSVHMNVVEEHVIDQLNV